MNESANSHGTKDFVFLFHEPFLEAKRGTITLRGEIDLAFGCPRGILIIPSPLNLSLIFTAETAFDRCVEYLDEGTMDFVYLTSVTEVKLEQTFAGGKSQVYAQLGATQSK